MRVKDLNSKWPSVVELGFYGPDWGPNYSVGNVPHYATSLQDSIECTESIEDKPMSGFISFLEISTNPSHGLKFIKLSGSFKITNNHNEFSFFLIVLLFFNL